MSRELELNNSGKVFFFYSNQDKTMFRFCFFNNVESQATETFPRTTCTHHLAPRSNACTASSHRLTWCESYSCVKKSAGDRRPWRKLPLECLVRGSCNAKDWTVKESKVLATLFDSRAMKGLKVRPTWWASYSGYATV